MKSIEDLNVKIYSDGAKLEDFLEMKKLGFIKGYTTNPTLMKKAGVCHYEKFIKSILPIVEQKPISFEVIADEFDQMKCQALKLAGYGQNIYVKIPIMNTKGKSSVPLIAELTGLGVKLNITAIMTLKQVAEVTEVLENGSPAYVSVFAGRIADSGRDPIPTMRAAAQLCHRSEAVELIWASSREVLNVFQAEQADCDIITVTPEIIAKFKKINYNLDDFSHDTVEMFYTDAVSSGLSL